jgi:MFS family permease
MVDLPVARSTRVRDLTNGAGMESKYAWVVVAVGGLMGCVAAGAMFSLAVFQDPIAEQSGWSRAGISGAMTLNFLFLGAGSFFWGWASDRVGTRIVVLAGAVILGLALLLACFSACSRTGSARNSS